MPIGFGKSGTELAIELDRPTGPYYPGDVVQATVRLDSEKEIKTSGLRAELVAWELIISEDSEGDTSRRSTLDEVVAGETLIEGMTLAAGFQGSYQVALPIPADAFPPYASSSIRSGWLVRATLDRGMKKDTSAEVDLPLVVPPPGERAKAGEVGESSHPGDAEMRLWLPSLEWVEGETIEGRLLIAPRKSFDAGEVRIQLVRQEKMRAPRYKGSNTDGIDRVVLAGKMHFEAGQAAEMAFEFPIPALGCPTRHTEATTVTYMLQALLTRRLRKGFTTSTEIWVYNGRRAG
jgi:hypothetical protein